MKRKITHILRRKFVKAVSCLIGEILQEYQNREWIKIRAKFKTFGAENNIQFPYSINHPELISIGNNFYASNHLRLDAITSFGNQTFLPSIIIGNNVSIESNCHIGAINKIIIEDNVMIASNIYISDHSHGNTSKEDIQLSPALRELISKGEVRICKNVWIGDSVCILPGVCIGENSIVGANSVVTKSFPSNVVIAGVPAKIIKSLI